MAVRQVLANRPAAGADWSFVVPAQWLPYLYGVTATLTTATATTTLADETGNGHTLTLVGGHPDILGAPGPYTGGAQNGSVSRAVLPSSPNNAFAQTAADVAFGPANLTVDGWWNALTAANVTQNGDFWGLIFPPSTQISVPGSNQNTNDPLDMEITAGGTQAVVSAGFMARNTWHHVAWTWDGANWRIYRDGALVTTTASKPYTGSGSALVFNVPGDGGNGFWRGSCAGVGFYNAALALANIAAHAAANSSASAYKTAVLADTPAAYWGLNTPNLGPSRIVTLQITDGTRTVAQFPANFTASTARSFIWSWQALGPGAQSSTDGVVNSVPIPEVSVDAGYVISSSTLDLAGTDQWGPITLWFDDGTGPTGTGGTFTQPAYLDALLVPPDWSPGS